MPCCCCCPRHTRSSLLFRLADTLQVVNTSESLGSSSEHQRRHEHIVTYFGFQWHTLQMQFNCQKMQRQFIFQRMQRKFYCHNIFSSTQFHLSQNVEVVHLPKNVEEVLLSQNLYQQLVPSVPKCRVRSSSKECRGSSIVTKFIIVASSSNLSQNVEVVHQEYFQSTGNQPK